MTFVPGMARGSHLRFPGAGIESLLSSTWGRADQQTPRTQFESGAFCFARKIDSAAPGGNGTREPFTVSGGRHRVVLEQHLGEG